MTTWMGHYTQLTKFVASNDKGVGSPISQRPMPGCDGPESGVKSSVGPVLTALRSAGGEARLG